MSKVAAAVLRFPECELQIHRLCARDPDFIEVCEDYADALAALKHWEATRASVPDRTDEYRAIVKELEAEILAALESDRGRKHPAGG